MRSFHQSKRSDNKWYAVEITWSIFIKNLTYCLLRVIPYNGRKYSHTNSYNSATTISAQSDHLTAEAWAACGGPCRKHARTKEYSIDLVENTSWQNLHTPTHVGPSCDFTCDWSKLNAWQTPWQHRLSTRGSLVAISHVIGWNWPDHSFRHHGLLID